MTGDAIDRLNALQASLPPNAFRGRLSFPEKCAAFLLAKRGFKHSTIALTFGVTQTTIANLARAGGQRYNDVLAEFERLGAAEFERRYWSDDSETRLSRWLARTPTESDRAKRRFGPNPNADSAAGRYRIHAYDGSELTFFVYWLATEGWTYRQDEEPGAFQSSKRLMTSVLARKAALQTYGVDGENILEFTHEPQC